MTKTSLKKEEKEEEDPNQMTYNTRYQKKKKKKKKKNTVWARPTTTEHNTVTLIVTRCGECNARCVSDLPPETRLVTDFAGGEMDVLPVLISAARTCHKQEIFSRIVAEDMMMNYN